MSRASANQLRGLECGVERPTVVGAPSEPSRVGGEDQVFEPSLERGHGEGRY